MNFQLLLILAMVVACVALLVVASSRIYDVYKSQFTESARGSLENLFLFVDPQVIFQLNLVVLVAIPLLVWLVTGSLALGIISLVMSAVVPRLFYGILQRRRAKLLIAQLPDALVMLSGAMRAGASLQIALDLVVNESPAPLSQEFSLILREQRLGMSLEDSLQGMANRLNVEDIDLFVSAMIIAKEVGGNLAEILDRLASTLRAKATMEGKIRALTSQGKLQGIVVSLLPVFLACVLYVMDPVAMRPLFTTYYGWAVMATVAVMLLLGSIFIRKIVSIDV